MWLLCFSSEYELGKFEETLAERYRETFQVTKTFLKILKIVVYHWREYLANLWILMGDFNIMPRVIEHAQIETKWRILYW